MFGNTNYIAYVISIFDFMKLRNGFLLGLFAVMNQKYMVSVNLPVGKLIGKNMHEKYTHREPAYTKQVFWEVQKYSLVNSCNFCQTVDGYFSSFGR